MPFNKIIPSRRAKAAIASALVAAAAGGWYSYKDTSPTVLPPAVILATDTLIKPWEGLVLTSHWDRYAKKFDICYGDTMIDGKPVKAGMRFTKEECGAILQKRVYRDYYVPLTKCNMNFKDGPVGWQAAMISLSYNVGSAAVCRSTAMKLAKQKKYKDSCMALTRFNRAGGRVVNGLVHRREMGDAQRIGEAETCVTGL
jgi:GH24 family phage-related lysozyme (muramidase)